MTAIIATPKAASGRHGWDDRRQLRRVRPDGERHDRNRHDRHHFEHRHDRRQPARGRDAKQVGDRERGDRDRGHDLPRRDAERAERQGNGRQQPSGRERRSEVAEGFSEAHRDRRRAPGQHDQHHRPPEEKRHERAIGFLEEHVSRRIAAASRHLRECQAAGAGHQSTSQAPSTSGADGRAWTIAPVVKDCRADDVPDNEHRGGAEGDAANEGLLAGLGEDDAGIAQRARCGHLGPRLYHRQSSPSSPPTRVGFRAARCDRASVACVLRSGRPKDASTWRDVLRRRLLTWRLRLDVHRGPDCGRDARPGLIVGAQRDDESGPVDLIVTNGRVYTGSGSKFAEAVAIRGNKILRVGTNRGIKRLRRPRTTVVDAHGGSVLPGFNDAHVHLMSGGLALSNVNLLDATTPRTSSRR